jgi:hypothetical protein
MDPLRLTLLRLKGMLHINHHLKTDYRTRFGGNPDRLWQSPEQQVKERRHGQR